MLAGCLLLAYLLPYRMYPFMAFYNEWLSIFGVTMALAFYAEQKSTNFIVPAIAALPIMLGVLIVMQASFGMMTFQWDAVLPVTYFILLALSMILAATVSKEANGSVRLCAAMAYAYLIAGILSSFIATMQFGGVESILMSFAMQMPHIEGRSIRPYANLGQPNQLALLFCFALASAWWLFQAGYLRPKIAASAACTFIWGLVLTQSRIGWLIMPCFIFACWSWRHKAGFKAIPTSLLTGFLLGYIILVYALPHIATIFNATSNSAIERIAANDGSARLAFLFDALQISLSHPWFGAGWNEFGPQQGLIASEIPGSMYTQHSHNIVMNFAAELGWPITFIVFGVLTYWFVIGCIRRPISKEVGFAILFFIATLIHSFVEFPLWYAYVLLPIGLFMGMVHREQFKAIKVDVSRIYVLVIFCLLSLGLVGLGMDYRRLVLGFRALGWHSLGLPAEEGTTSKPAFTVFPQYYDYMKFAQTKPREGMSPEEIAFMEQVAKRFGYSPVLLRMSLIYCLNGRPDDAVRSMATLNRLYRPFYAEAYQTWRGLAELEPNKYGRVFKRIQVLAD